LLGRSGLRVSELCLGTMTFGAEGGWGAAKDECGRILEAFAEAGGNFIDTANAYTNGASEQITGELVAAERARWVLATKYTVNTRPGDPNGGGSHRKHMVQALDASLRRLGTDYVDVYWLHVWDVFTPVEEVMRGLDDLVRAARCCMSASRTRRRGSCRRPTRWPSCGAGRPSSASRCPTAWSSARPSGSCCPWPKPSS